MPVRSRATPSSCGAHALSLEAVAIVDPYDAGSMLAPAFGRRGVAAVMVGSTPDVPESEAVTFDPASFVRRLPWPGALEPIVQALRESKVGQVIAGSERGVELADRLAEALALPGNSTRSSAQRRDKLAMIEAAAAAGLRTPRQAVVDSLDALLAWAEANGGWPLIVKPRRAKGSEGVRLCETPADAARALAEHLGATDRLGSVNATLLVQQYLRGREYVVDTVSLESRHRLAALWAYGKPPPGFDTVGTLATKQLLAAYGPLAETLFGFAKGVLDAVGIQRGAGHCEVIVGTEGPVLVEIGARLHGGPPAHLMCRAATGSSQLDLLVEACVEPRSFLASIEARYQLNRGAAMALLRDDKLRGTVEALPSAQRVVWNAPAGSPQPPVAGLVTLIHPDPREVDADLEIVTNGVTCAALSGPAAIADLTPAWQALLESSRADRAFGGPAWYRAALAVSPHLSPALITGMRGKQLAGILPLAWDPERKVASFATPLADYNDVIVARDDLAAARAMIRFARRHFPAIEFDCVRPDAECRRAEPQALLVERRVTCPYADLSSGYEAWIASRSARFRHDLGQLERRAARDGLMTVRLDPGTPGIVERFLELHRDRFGPRSLFARDVAARLFVEEALPDLLDQGNAIAFAVEAEARIVGINLCMRGAESLGYWNAGFETGFAGFSPGTLMIHAALRHACTLGLSELDFLRGAEAYKARWCTGALEIGRLA